jgi:hypothetical protein
MAIPERVLVDTSAFYALLSSTDEFDERARTAYERLLDREQELWTTSYILVEMAALTHRRLGFEALETFVRSVDRGPVPDLLGRKQYPLTSMDRTRRAPGRRSRVRWLDDGLGRKATASSAFYFRRTVRQRRHLDRPKPRLVTCSLKRRSHCCPVIPLRGSPARCRSGHGSCSG